MIYAPPMIVLRLDVDLPAPVPLANSGITALDPANAADHPRPTSLPSAPCTLMHAPLEPPAAPDAAALTIARGAPDPSGAVDITIEVADAPTAHAKAIGPYRLAVWSQWPGQPIEPVTVAGEWHDLSDGVVTVTVAAPPAPVDPGGPITLRIAFADPLGRLGELTPIGV